MTIIGLSANATYHPTVPAWSGQGWIPSVMDDRLCFRVSGKNTAGDNNRFTLGHSLAKVMAITFFPPVSWMDRYLSTSIPVSIWS